MLIERNAFAEGGLAAVLNGIFVCGLWFAEGKTPLTNAMAVVFAVLTIAWLLHALTDIAITPEGVELCLFGRVYRRYDAEQITLFAAADWTEYEGFRRSKRPRADMLGICFGPTGKWDKNALRASSNNSKFSFYRRDVIWLWKEDYLVAMLEQMFPDIPWVHALEQEY